MKTPNNSEKAVKRAREIFHAEPGTPEDDEPGVSLLLIKDYEDKTIKMPAVDVLEIIKQKAGR